MSPPLSIQYNYINKVLCRNNNRKEGRSLLIVKPTLEEKQLTSEAESESLPEPMQKTNDNHKILPVLNPEFNFREIVKNSILLEDHLNHPGKQCGDCIMKHMLALESYADELLSLTPRSDLIDYAYLQNCLLSFADYKKIGIQQEDHYTIFHKISEKFVKNL